MTIEVREGDVGRRPRGVAPGPDDGPARRALQVRGRDAGRWRRHETVYLVATLDGSLAGSGLGGRSDYRLRRAPPARPARHAATWGRDRDPACAGRPRRARLGFTEAGTSGPTDDGSLAFAERFGFARGGPPARTGQDRRRRTVAGRARRYPRRHGRRARRTVAAPPTTRSPWRPSPTWRPIGRSSSRRPSGSATGCPGRRLGSSPWSAMRSSGSPGLDADEDRRDSGPSRRSRPCSDRGAGAVVRRRVLKRMTLAFAAAQRGPPGLDLDPRCRHGHLARLTPDSGSSPGATSITVRASLPIPAPDVARRAVSR